MPEAAAHPDARRAAFILTIWSDTPSAAEPNWRGYLETGDGQRQFFRTLAELNQRLRHLSGWNDPPASLQEDSPC
jgi:hypothetical protein